MKIETKRQIFQFKQDGIAGVEWGNLESGAETVLFLHGWLDNLNSYFPLLSCEQFDPKLRCIAIDFPGHGLSDWRSHDAQYYFVDYVADIVNFLDNKNIERCHFVGHSMGALVANVVASCFPQKVISLSLIDGMGILFSNENTAKSQLTRSIEQRQTIKRRKPKRFKSKEDIIQARKLVSDLSESLIRILMERSITETDGGWTLTSDPKLKVASPFRYSKQQALSLLSGIEASTLVVFGSKGLEDMKQQVDVFKACYKTINTVFIEGGHHCHMESPSLTFKHISAHINANNRSEL
ncbi:alpha/beta fold hydrolase [Pseudoalteromonas xiamenensis]|uniref:Alpha/beta hydrolase n=1 Tax=Pseudoalteromonas xiamenensis TaxID=882626 RepID=A0A975DK09_9GAMM|nr:alpha/beta hydrolase [Pseudoalteromonas xiamenensis]QTH73155.1 alpha/beta hydrolase [Pseudoalteromonas xiamenensis]